MTLMHFKPRRHPTIDWWEHAGPYDNDPLANALDHLLRYTFEIVNKVIFPPAGFVLSKEDHKAIDYLVAEHGYIYPPQVVVEPPEPPPVAIAIADFKAGIYEIGGVATTLEAMLLENEGFLYSQVEPGVGWHLAGATGAIGGYPLATPALLAVLADGTTVAQDFRYFEPAQWVTLGVWGTDDTTEDNHPYVGINYNPGQAFVGVNSESHDPPAWAAEYDYFDTIPEPGVLHRLVTTLIAPENAASFDGRPTISIASLVPDNDPIPGDFWLMGHGGGPGVANAGPSDTVIERAIFYAPQAKADLPALSAPVVSMRDEHLPPQPQPDHRGHGHPRAGRRRPLARLEVARKKRGRPKPPPPPS